MKTYENVSEAYLGTLADVYYNPDVKSSPRGHLCREKLDYTFRVLQPDASPIVTKDQKRNGVIESYTKKEVQLYDSCTNSAQDFGEASKFWLTLANPNGTVNSAYGYLIWANRSAGSDFESPGGVRRTPWEYARQCLINDKDTRQATMNFSLPEHKWIGNKDQVCTLHGNWLIRNNQLHFSIVMRSNDLNRGLVYDLPWFCSLMDKMAEELKEYYPNLKKGHYTHFVHSLHIYEKEEETIKKMLGHVV